MKLLITVDDAEYELIKNLGIGEVPSEVCEKCCPYFNISYECEEACPARTLVKKVVRALPDNSNNERRNKMTENEIIEYLKENKNKGVMYIFMPEEVKDWCFYKKEYRSDFLLYKPDRGGWVSISDDFVLAAGYVIALPEDFKLREKPEGGWVEFDINKNGDFEISGIEKDKNTTIIYNWTQWNKPIRDNSSKNFINGCCAFGGWKFEDDGCWHTCPTFKHSDEGDKPCIPVKIRFWKGEMK